jgi:hypothetical protein
MAFDGQVVSSGHQGLRSRLAVPAGPQGMLKHAGLQMPDKVARVAAAAAVWREEWQLACQSGGRTASTSCICVDDRESCVVSLSAPGLAWHLVLTS